jgi:hypothetical protein
MDKSYLNLSLTKPWQSDSFRQNKNVEEIDGVLVKESFRYMVERSHDLINFNSL